MRETIESTSSSEFVEWIVYLDRIEWEVHTKQDHYFAQLSADIAQVLESFASNPRIIHPKDRLLKFERVEGPQDSNAYPRGYEEEEEKSPEEIVKEVSQRDKAICAAIFKIPNLMEEVSQYGT